VNQNGPIPIAWQLRDGAGPPHTAKRPEIRVDITDPTPIEHTPALNDLNCPRCKQPWRAGHPCPEGGDQ
jgi:hypothetical protein